MRWNRNLLPLIGTLAFAAPAAAAVEVSRGAPIAFAWSPASGADSYHVYADCNEGERTVEFRTEDARAVIHTSACDTLQIQVAGFSDELGSTGALSEPSEMVVLVGQAPPPAPGAFVTPGAPVANDFDGDGTADLALANPDTGQVQLWASEAGGAVPLPWPEQPAGRQLSAHGDLDGDGQADVIWTDPATREVGATLIDRGYPTAEDVLGVVEPGWTVVATADCDGDGRDEVVLHHVSTGGFELWRVDPLILVEALALDLGTFLQFAGVGDFDGDGKDDLLFQNPAAAGQAEVWLLDGDQVKSTHRLGAAPFLLTLAAVGDFDGDGFSDAIWTNPVNGVKELWFFGPGLQIEPVPLSSAWQSRGPEVVSAGDHDGDGIDDLFIRRRRGKLEAWLMSGSLATQRVFLGTAPKPWGAVN